MKPSKEDKEAWRKVGGNSTTNIPMLEMDDGKVFTQSGAVLRAVGRMGNLLPTDNAIVNYVKDVYLNMTIIAPG